MATISSALPALLLLLSILNLASAARQLGDPISIFRYHNGPLLAGKIPVNLIWYGNFKPSQRAIVSDFISSLSSPAAPNPSVSAWWSRIQELYKVPKSSNSKPSFLSLSLGTQTLDERYSLGKTLTSQNVEHLARKAGGGGGINVVLTAADVAVEGFCTSTCGRHAHLMSPAAGKKGQFERVPFVWVGNPESQCPGRCAWPFHQPIYGPQTPPLVAPSGDVGMDGLVINLATLLAGTATNPFGNGFFQGPATAPLEAASACPGIYGTGAYPGFAGNLLVDKTTRASYNANGVGGKKFLVPGLFEPATNKCWTLV